MAKYRVEWQMGGEFVVEIDDKIPQKSVERGIDLSLESIAVDASENVASDQGFYLVSGHCDGTAESTIHKLEEK